jgi:hypothetical protein
MRRLFLVCLILILAFSLSYARNDRPKLILLISEQNIAGPQHAWWASEIDLSTTESAVAQKLIDQGYTVIEPSSMSRVIKQDKALRIVDLSETASVRLGNLSKADYVVLGKALASSGANVPQSNMRSCFANITAKIIRIKDGKVIAYLEATGSSVHTDVVTGGKEALANAGADLAAKLVDKIIRDQEGGK